MKTPVKLLSLVVTVMMGLSISASSWGQSPSDSLSMDEDQIMASIARYPADMRSAILDVSQYPKVLVKLEQIQARSSQSFQDLVEPLSRNEQQQLYEASRFPETISQLVMTGKGHPERISSILRDFPADLQQQLSDAYNNHYDELVRMDRIYNTAQGKLQNLTDQYPESVQKSFQKILANPDVMTLLTDNINLTVELGQSYQSDPQGIRQQLDQMNFQLSEQNGKDLLAYKEAVAKDPALQDEMKSAAGEYAQQNNQSGNAPAVVNNYYTSAPYPYWFGYPYWYGSPLWYPYSFYQTGYYFGSGGIVILGMPSLGYSRWFYSRGYYNRYPRLYHCYNTYYNMPTRNIVSGYRTIYTGGNNSYKYHNYRSSGSYYNGNHSRGSSQGGNSYSGGDRNENRSRGYSNGNNSYSGSDRYSRGSMRNPQSNTPNLQQGSSYNQPYQRYHANTYNPGLRSTGYGGRGFSSGSTAGRGFNGAGGSRGFSSGGFSGGGARGFGGGGHGFGSGGGGRGRR